MAKVLIAAQLYLEATGRDHALKTAQSWIDGALAQPGCLHYDWSVDLNDPTRINVYEEWESEESLAAHFAGAQYTGMRDHLRGSGLINAASKKFRVDAEGPVYDAEGNATPKFD